MLKTSSIGLVLCLTLACAGSARADSLPAATGFQLKACSAHAPTSGRLDFAVGGTSTWAQYALPQHRPKAIVVYAHGYSEWPTGHVSTPVLEALANNAGVLAIAPDLRGTRDPAGVSDAGGNSRGFSMAAGAEDLAAVARAALARCPVPTVISMGGSMGGGIAGLAVTLDATRRGGAPLFDYWVSLSGLMDIAPDWAAARALGASAPVTGGDWYRDAADDIEAEMGGTPATAGQSYLAHSMITRAGDVAAAGLRGAVLLHSAGDTDITPEQTSEMFTGLVAHHVPAEAIVATTAEHGEHDNSLDRFLVGPLPGITGVPYDQQLAGHESAILIRAAAARLAALVRGQGIADGKLTVLAGGQT